MDRRDELIANVELGKQAKAFLDSDLCRIVLHDHIGSIEVGLLNLAAKERDHFTALAGARDALKGVKRTLEALVSLGQQSEQIIANGEEGKTTPPRIL